jgi:hypothetical protein
MGWGDEIMVTGQVKELNLKYRKKVAVVDKYGRPRTNDLWRNNPRIVYQLSKDVLTLENYSGNRPYVDYRNTTKQRWAYTDWRCTPGEVFLYDDEIETAVETEGSIIIEPHIKQVASPNKLWGFEKTQRLVDILRPHYDLVQLGPQAVRSLKGVSRIITHSFRQACAYISTATATISPEGGIHHAAAAFRVPAVVMFGSMTSPRNTGYEFHRNLVANLEHSPCGWRVPCTECKRAMDLITPEFVADQLEELINEYYTENRQYN